MCKVSQQQKPKNPSSNNYLTDTFVTDQKLKLLEFREKIRENFRRFKEESLAISPDGLSEEGDVAQNHLDQKMTFSLRERDLKTLREIELALSKIEEGSYGICEESGEPIEKVRLEKSPWARLSLYYAELEEKESKRYR
jgi:DnaK suppressor protein